MNSVQVRMPERSHHVALAAATFVWILAYWNFIGGRT